MPTLKQLTCRIEFGPKNIQLKEYGTNYGDGVVSTYISVPSEPQNFSIHLTSSGYIAPGLAMFVFIDGVAQCNRNRRGLVMADEKTDKSLCEIDFRVRQKEERFDVKSFIGREWKFEHLQTADADNAPKLSDDTLDSIGTIEVVVLRCYDDESRRKLPTRPAIDDGRGMNFDGSYERPVIEEESISFGLDGAFDDRYPESPPTEVRRQLWDEAQAVLAEQKPEHSPAPDKDGANDDRGRYPLAGLGRAFERHGISGYRDPGGSRHASASRIRGYPPLISPEMAHGVPANPWHGNPYLNGFDNYDRYARQYGSAFARGYAEAMDDPLYPPKRGRSKSRSNAEQQGPCSDKRENSKASTRKAGSKAASVVWTADKSNGNDNSDNKADWGANQNVNSGNDNDNWGDPPPNNNTWENANENNNTWEIPNQNNGTWNTSAEANNANDSKRKERSKPKTRNNKSKSRNNLHSTNEPPTQPIDPDKPHIKPYFQKWSLKPPPTNSNPTGTRNTYILPSEPRLLVPAPLAAKHNIQHQVHPGAGKLYAHSTATPAYLDSMAAPYAVFVFRYRDKSTLEEMFKGVLEIREDREPFRERMRGLSKEEVVEKLMRAKKAAGYGTDSDLDEEASSANCSGDGEDASNGGDRDGEKEKSRKGGGGGDGAWAAQGPAQPGASASWQQGAAAPTQGW